MTDDELTAIEQRAETAHPGPRTYQSAWQWDNEGRPIMMTAEEWLEEEAAIDASMSRDDEDSGPSRAGTIQAIAKEIATLRREKSEWAADYTRLTAELAELRARPTLGQVLNAIDNATWRSNESYRESAARVIRQLYAEETPHD